MRNLYDVLAIDPGADDEQIREAFQSLAKIFHPDLNLGDAVAERRFKEICQAYGMLKDPRTRAAYELGLVHQRGRARRRVSTAAMTGFATSMLSTIVIALVMVWLLTDGRQSTPSGQNRSGEGQTRKTAIGLSHDQAFAQRPAQNPLIREPLLRLPS
ncbi:MAG: J domain-containing protein [Hyphomicrobiaceae bacterium]